MKSRHIALTGAVAIGIAAIAAGCGASPSTTTPTSSAPQKGGTIVYALPPQTNLNWYIPIVNSGYDSLYSFQLIYQMYKPLLWINNKYAINYKSSIADKIVYNSAGTVYHVFMNPKWTWSNGHHVTTKDVLFTWNVIKAASAPNAPSPWPYVGAGTGDIPTGVQSVVANSKYEFTVTLKKPANQEWFIYNGLSDFTPLPSAAWNKYPTNITQEIKYLGAQGTNPKFDSVVDGPFKLQSATSSQSWVLVPNPSYAGQKAYSSKIIFSYQGSNSAEFAALKTGAVQVGYVDFAEYGARKQLTNDILRPQYGFQYFDIELNMQSNAQNGLGPVFNQLYVRQALETAINQQAVNKALYFGFGPPQYGPIPTVPSTIYLAPQLKNPVYPYNPTKAKSLLTSHGWSEVNGVMTKNGVPLKFTLMYASGSQTTTEQMSLIQQEWAKIGVQVTLKPLGFATLEGIIGSASSSSQWDAAGGQGIIYGGSYPSGGALFGGNGIGLDNYGYTDAKEKALIAATHQPYPNQQANLAAFFNYEVYTAKQLPNLWVNQVGIIAANAKNIHNSYKYTNALTGYPQMQYWWTGK